MRVGIIVLLAPVWLAAQRPVVTSVRNAASYSNGYGSGSLVSVFGTNLAIRTETASTIPLPTSLAGTSVSFFGAPAFLLYVSPTQINLQIPKPPENFTLTVQVTTPNGSSDPVDAHNDDPNWGASAFGLFTADASGCSQAAALKVDRATGATSVNSRENSVSPGEFVTLFGTGVCCYIPFNPTPDGTPTPLSPLFRALSPIGPNVLDFGRAIAGGSGTWLGRAPGLIGVDQLNIEIPPTAREGCAVPFQTGFAGTSRPVTLAIRRGGGACVDGASAGYADIVWERAETTRVAGQTTVEETVTASLQAVPAPIPDAPSYTAGDDGRILRQYFGPSCPVPGYRSLNAGVLSGEAPGRNVALPSLPLPFAQVTGLMHHRAVLPGGTIQPGSYRVAATGGADAAAFQSSVTIGSGIRITTDLANRRWRPFEPLVVEWRGGDPDSWVILTVTSGRPEWGLIQSRRAVARAAAGVVRMSAVEVGYGPPDPADIVVEVVPDPSRIATAQATGLVTVRHSWKYSYRFPLLRGGAQ